VSLRVGLVGCGIIGRNYAHGSQSFDSFDIVACCDIDREQAEAFAKERGLEAATFEELLAAREIDVILNLTPATAHAPILLRALEAGKHVHTEKPLATSFEEAAEVMAEAGRRGLRVGCAPDTFLGSAYQAAERLIAEGRIGEPILATATMLVGGPEAWHPNAEIFYGPGGGPLLDIGPYHLTAIAALLGPFRAATGFASTLTAERTLAAGPRAGAEITIEVPTHVTAAFELASGAFATLSTTFESGGQYESTFVINGSEGSLELPDVNGFGGTVRLRRGRDDWKDVRYDSFGGRDTRGIGLDEMARAMAAGRPHRASGALGLHVLETATAVLRSAEQGGRVEVAPPA
jgi:predicted dehydrogenase